MRNSRPLARTRRWFIVQWLTGREKNRPSLQTGRVWRPSGVTPLEMFVYNNILLKSSLDYRQNGLGSNDILMKNQRLSLNKWSKLDHPWWLTIQSLWGMGQLWKIMTSCIIQWESNEKNEDWTSGRGGATMQTSPYRVFKLPIPHYLIWRIPDRVHGGCKRNVNKANSLCRQKIIVLSDFVHSCCDGGSLDECLKK